MKRAFFAAFVLTAVMLTAMIGVVFPVATAQSGIDLTDGSEIALESMNVEMIPAESNYGKDGTASYNVTVSGTVKTDGLPLLYPVRLTFYDVSDYSGPNTKSSLESSNDATSLEQTTTVLSPTNPNSFVPAIRDSESEDERIMTRTRKITVAFSDLLNMEPNSVNKDVVVIAESIRSQNVAADADEVEINGGLPEGFSSSTVQESNDVNILTGVSFVDSYRISGDNENPQFAENLELPSPSDGKLSGEVRGFNGMRSPFGNSTVVSGDNNISMVTRTGDIPSGRPYTLTVTYQISEGDEVELRPINPVGQDITESSNYVLPADPSEEDYCREISVEDGTLNMCNIFLNEGEVDLTSSLKELLVHYKADDSTTISISCQSVISGYLPNNRESCGVDPADGEPDEPTADTIIDAQGLAGDPSDDSTQWTSPEVPVTINDEQDADHNLRYDVRETISGAYDSGDHVVRVFRQDEHVGPDGEILQSATPIYQDTVSDYNGGAWNEFTETDRPASDLPERYHFLLCQPGSTVPDTCGIDNNVGHDDLTFKRPVSNSVDLDVKSPVVINPLEIDNVREDQLEVRTETLEIPDPNYLSQTWQIQNGGDPVIEDFSGTIRQEVTVNNVFEDKVDRAQSGEILPEALDKRSDSIPDSQWDYEVSVTRTEFRDMVVPSSQDINNYVRVDSGWTESYITEPRSVQVGTEQQNFPIVNGDSFATRVEGQERWYPLRNSNADRPETEFVFDTRLQRTDPDRCLNCLTTETVSDANARLGSSQGGLTEAVGTSQGVDAWQRASDEPTIVNGRETDSQFFSRSAIVANTLTYNNLGTSTDSRFKYRQRQSEKESIRLYQYEYAPDILEPLFERPVTEQVQRYTRHRYDVTYTFTADVQNKDIYRYERTVRDDIIEYEDRHIAWVDISRSSPTEEINQFEVQFEGAEQPIVVDWINGIHSLPPDERDSAIDSMCSGDPEPIGNQINDEYPVSLGLTDPAFNELERLDGLYQGNGGVPVVQRCTIDGEEKIVRVGQEYNETGIFSYDVNLVSSGSEEQGVVEVIGERPDEDGAFEPQIGSEPEISDVTAINDKVDYRIGTVPITGDIVSQTNDLDGDYEITVTPADNIGSSSVSCSELGGGYRSVMDKSLTDSYPSGASFRQVERCIASEFEDPSEAPDRFELFRTYGSISVDPGNFIIEASDVPAGAVQRCIDPFSQNSGDCVATVSSPISQSNAFEYENPDGTYKSIDKYEPAGSFLYDIETPGIGYQCPAGYEMTREQQDADQKEDYSTTQVRYCQLENPDALSIDLRSRTASYQFESVDQGIVTECSAIPTVGQDGNHDGYTDSTASGGTANCVLQGDGQGPSGFTLYSNSVDAATGGTDTNYESLPAGAFRGKSFVTGEEADLCNEVRIENDGAMICEYDTGSETIDVRFGTRNLGEWTSSSDTVSNLLDQTNARKAIWQGENIAPTTPGEYKEDFTTTINPRNAGISIDQQDVEFTIELRKTVTGEVIQEETVEVRLCAAEQIQDRSELPRSDRGSYECEDFDTMMTGEDDFQGTQSVSDAIEDYEAGGFDGRVETYTIDTVQNDACPYTHEFPRDQSSLVQNTDAYTFDIQANNYEELREEEERINQEIVSVLSAQYSPIGEDPCERAEDIGEIPTFVDDPADFEIEFNKRTFANEESSRFTRIAGLEDLHKIVPNPVQNRWTKDDLGSAVRLGHPILLKESSSALGAAYGQEPQPFDVNEGLVAHYTFNHNTDQNLVTTRHSYSRREYSDIRTLSSVPNHYVIQDVGMRPTVEAPDGLETSYSLGDLDTDEYHSEGIYNARLWYASPCHEAYEYQEDGAVYNPEVVQPIENGVGPRINSHAFNPDPCENLLTSEEAQNQISGYEFDTNAMASFYRNFGSPGVGARYRIPSFAPRAERLEESTPLGQSAFLPVPPTDDWESEYSETGGVPGRITDAYEAVGDNYAEKRGVFGGNALRLDKTSWMMITPPCHDKDAIGESLSSPSISNSIVTGDQPSCDPTEELDSSQWRGGWQEAYTNPDKQLDKSSIHNELGDEYTVSFWVNTEAERQSMSEVAADDGSSVAPLRSLYSTSLPVQDPALSSIRNANIMPSTAELSLVRAPEYISIEDLPQEAKDESDKLSGDRVKPLSWDYPGHFTLRDTARACMASSGTGSDTLLGPDSRPVMCEVFEASNSEYAGEYDDLTQYEDETPDNLVDAAPFLEDFRKEMISRTVYEPRLDWPVGDSVKRGSEGFPAFNRTDEFGDGEEYGDIISCYYATQREDAINGNECYDTGRYAYSDHGDISNIQADNGFGNSDWQHVAITYEKDSSGRRDFEIKINGELAGTPAGDNLELNDFQERDNIKVGELYQGSVMSIGAVYQGPGYNMDPNNLDATLSGDFVPYVHASQGEVLIDEMRIYNRELTAQEINSRLPNPVPSSQHDLPADVPMYTGELETEPEFTIPNGTLISGVLEDRDYRTFEVDVDAGSDGPAAYKIDIIPCVSNTDCLRDASVTVSEANIPDEERATSTTISDTTGTDPTSVELEGALGSAGTENLDVQLTGTSEVVRFSGEDLPNSQLDEIVAFKLDMTLGTPYVDSSPVIRNIEMTPAGDPYSSCQEIAGDHPGAQGLFGSEFDATILDSTGVITDTKCDMKRSGGNWTRFAWVDVSDGNSFSKDIQQGDPMFKQDTTLSDCDAEDSVCFASANWNETVMDNIDSRTGPHPQVMVKAIDGGQVVDWASFQFSENAHRVIGTDKGVDSVRVVGRLAKIFSGDQAAVTGDGPYSSAGERTSAVEETSGPDAPEGLYEECLHPFDNSGQFNRRCISHTKLATEGGTQTLFMSEMSASSVDNPIVSGRRYGKQDMVRIERNYEDNTIEDLSCVGRNVDRCEFYYRYGDNFDPFGGDMGIRGDAVFDLADYNSTQTQKLSQNLPRGYTFSVEYDTNVTSLYSSYTGGSSNDWFIGLYSSDDQGNIDNDGLIAGSSAQPAEQNPGFVGNDIDEVTLEAGQYYTIVQGKDDVPDNGNHLGWSGPDFNMSHLLGENPVGIFKPAAQGETHAYSISDRFGLEGESPSLDPASTPRIGFDYEVIDTQFQNAEGQVIDFTINPDRITSGTVDYTVTNTVTGEDVTSESSITSPIAYTTLGTTDLDGSWDECDEGLLTAQASWTDSEGDTHVDTATLEVDRPVRSDCPVWTSANQELVEDIAVDDDVTTAGGVRGFRIEPDQPIRVDSLGIGIEFRSQNSYDTSNIDAWGAIYETNSDTPTSVVARTDDIGPSDTNGPNLQNYDLRSTARLDAGQQYILAVGGEIVSGGRTTGGSAIQYVLRDNSPIIGDDQPDINWGNARDLNIVNNRALKWNLEDPGRIPGSSGSNPDYILGDSADNTDPKYPPNIRMNYEYYE